MKRPPKEWWDRTFKRFSKNPEITDPARVVGNIWYHKMTEEKRAEILKKYEKKRSKKKKSRSRKMGNCAKPETMGKHYKKRSKKRISEKQQRSLAKGRKVLSYLRTGRQVSEPKEPLLIKEGFFMAKTKRKMSAKQKAALARGRKKAAAQRSLGFEGFEGGKKKKKATVKHQIVMRGGDPGPDIAGMGIDLAGLLAGAIGLSFIASIIPLKNPKIKALIPMIAGLTGLAFPAISGNRFMSRAALGAVSIGGYSLTKQLVPKIPLMGATDTAEGIGEAIANLPPEEQAILGIVPEEQQQIEYQGDQFTDDMLGETSMIEGMPGEMLGSEPGEMLGETEMIGAAADDSSDFE